MENPLLQVEDLCVRLPSPAGMRSVLEHICFSIAPGKTLALVGESGSGKSITALSILGLLPQRAAKQGVIRLDGTDSFNRNLLQQTEAEFQALRGSAIAMVFQEPMTALNPVFSIGYTLSEAICRMQHTDNQQARSIALQLLAEVALPADPTFLKRYPHELSGGQQQRVMIALALAGNPRLLIADEPTTALDVTVQRTLLELLRSLQQKRGMGMLFISHDLGLVGDIADDILVLYQGKTMEYGPAQQVLQQPQHPYTKALLACRPERHEPGTKLPVVADFMHPASPISPPTAQFSPASPQPLQLPSNSSLRVENLSVQYGAHRVLESINLTLAPGETLAIVGESGSGKSTLAKALVRLVPIHSGAVWVDELPLEQIPRKSLARKIQLVFQDPYGSLNPRQTIGALLEEPLRVHFPTMRSVERKARVDELLMQVELSPDVHQRFPAAFSGGQRQRIVIARALAVQPAILIFDESVSALDVSVQAQILNLLQDLQASLGFASLFISHDLSVVRHCSQRLLVLEKGRIVEQGNTAEVMRSPQHPYTQQLLAASFH
jgi:peptide/nickel transport system ATP-binding protein